MFRKLVGTVLLLGILYVIVFVARDNLSLDDWRASSGDDQDSRGDFEIEA